MIDELKAIWVGKTLNYENIDVDFTTFITIFLITVGIISFICLIVISFNQILNTIKLIGNLLKKIVIGIGYILLFLLKYVVVPTIIIILAVVIIYLLFKYVLPVLLVILIIAVTIIVPIVFIINFFDDRCISNLIIGILTFVMFGLLAYFLLTSIVLDNKNENDETIKEINTEDPYYTLHVDTTPPKNPSSSGGSSSTDTSLDRYLETDIISPPNEIDATEITISKTETVYCGDMANISVKVEPNTEYHIAVYYSSGRSNADGLGKKTSDKDGYISWSWRIGSRTHAGEYRIEIYNSEKTYVTSFVVK